MVELEDGFCAASADVENVTTEKQAGIKAHEVNTDFTNAADFSSGSWD